MKLPRRALLHFGRGRQWFLLRAEMFANVWTAGVDLPAKQMLGR
jgi:hypothetical protein